MSATPPVPPKAKQQATKQTTKQQRAAERQRQLEEFKRREARSKRNRRILVWAGAVGGLVAVGLLVTAIVLAPKGTNADAAADGGGGASGAIEGVQTFSYQGGAHVEGPIDYTETPPAGGEHNQVWLNCGVYSQPVPNENAVHSLEHGAVWVTVDPSLPADELGKLTAELPTTYVVLSPYEGLPSPIVLSAWNAQLQVEDASDPRIAQFVEQYWQSQNAPEPGAPCSGGLDAPGKLS